MRHMLIESEGYVKVLSYYRGKLEDFNIKKNIEK